MLHKNLANSLKDVDTNSGVVCFYGSSFNVVDDGNDMVLPGAYTKTIAEQGPQSKQPRIKHLYQHDTTAILGMPQVLKEDGFGLYVESKVVPTTLGKDCLLLYEAGVITEHSIGYEVVDATWDRAKAVRLLRELKLFEVSAVTWGMNSETPTVGVKSLTDPSRLTAMAEQAQRLDSILHSGNLRSDALCETLERELKALQTALAPSADAASQPYSIQGVLDSMTDLKNRLGGSGSKTATQEDKDAQEARSKKYGIGIKDGGNVTKPGKYSSLSDDDFADPVNYSYPVDTKAHADNAASRFGDEDNRAVYTKAEQAIIDDRIAAAQKKFGEDKDDEDDNSKSAPNTRLVKGTGGAIEVSSDGTHAAYSGTHTHSHKAFGSQGDDDMHSHSHTHDGDAKHNHPDDHKSAPKPQQKKQRGKKTFEEHYNEAQCEDLLRDWQDVVLSAFTSAVYDAFQIGDEPESDVSDALDALKNAVSDWVDEAMQYGLSDYLDAQGYDGGTAYQMQNGSGSYYSGYWSNDPVAASKRAPKGMPAAPARLGKAGRAISSANRQVITDALDGMSDAMDAMQQHHAAIADLMSKTDPDAVRQDEDDALGDDDTENGGTNINKGRYSNTNPTRRTAAGRTPQAGTTHPDGKDQNLDLSAALADLDALKSRLVKAGGKA